MAEKVIVLELNEITWDLLDRFMSRGLLPNFRTLVEQGVRANAWASEKPEHLDPWITWTTLYTGVPQEEHQLSMLEQDAGSLGAPRLWEYLSREGLRLGIFGSANSWPPRPVDGFWVPGPFSQDFATYPQELEPIQALNVGLTRGHTTAEAKGPRLPVIVPKLMRLGLRPSTVVRLARAYVRIKRNPSERWRLAALQPVLNYDVFSSLYRRYRPQFATFHSNHVAYYMHRFWRAMEPDAFEVPPTQAERETYGSCIQHGYQVADEILGALRQLAGKDTTLVVLSSCGQQPATGGRYTEDHKHGNVGLQIRIPVLLDLLGLKDVVQYSNLMAPQWKLDCADGETLERVAGLLRQVHNVTRNAAALAVQIEGDSICLGAHRNQQLDDTLTLPTRDGSRQVVAGELLDRHSEVVKSGRHHPKGVLLMAGPKVRSGVNLGDCDNLDIAPTLLRVMEQPVPRVMKGKALEAALTTSDSGSSTSKRTPVAAGMPR